MDLKMSMITSERGGCRRSLFSLTNRKGFVKNLRTALPDLLYPPQQTNGLFSVPAPSLHLGETAGFFIALVMRAQFLGSSKR
jgi:hypothetical protein